MVQHDHAEQATAGIPADLVDHREYPLDRHLFADSDWHGHDKEASDAMLETISAWLTHR